MGHIIYSIPIEEVYLAVQHSIVRTLSFNGMQYDPLDLHLSEDGDRFYPDDDEIVFVAPGTLVNVTFYDLYEEYWEIKNRYELAESYKKKYGVRKINVWVENYISLDGFNEDGSPKFSIGGTIKDE